LKVVALRLIELRLLTAPKDVACVSAVVLHCRPQWLTARSKASASTPTRENELTVLIDCIRSVGSLS
jgi:hypothetical protein